MVTEFGPKITKSEYEIFRAVPMSLNYTHVAKKAGFSVAYVSRKLKALKEKAAVHGVFNYEAMGLKQIRILADFNEDFIEKEKKVKVPFLVSLYHIVSGKKDYMWIEAVPPADQVKSFVEGLQLENYKVYSISMRFDWRPDTSMLTYYSGGYILGDIDKLPETYERMSVEKQKKESAKVPDEIDLWLIARLMKYPFTKISREAEKSGIRQQVASYHLIRHVKPLWAYNVVDLRLDPDLVPTKIFMFKTGGEDESVKLAATLVQVPYIRSAFTSEEEEDTVIAYITIPGSLEMKLIRTIRGLEAIQEFEELGAVEKDVMLRLTLPYGKIVGGGRWVMDGYYQAIKAMSSEQELESYKPLYEVLTIEE